MKLAGGNFPRQISRENAGRKSNWKNKDTVTIRVPKAIVFQVIEVAHKIDSGENIELKTESKAEGYDFDMKSKISNTEIVTQSNKEGQKLESDFVTKSKISYGQAIVQIQHTRHRSVSNFLVNVIAGIIAYTHQDKKPSLNLTIL